MANNIYGGINYSNSSFIFDKIYSSYKDAIENCTNDSVFLGRYILIQYHPTIAYTFDDQIKIINNPLVTGEEKIWRDNYEKDSPNNYNTVVCQKRYDTQNNNFQYIPIAHLGTSYSTEYVDSRIGNLGDANISVKTYVDSIKEELSGVDTTLNEQIEILIGHNIEDGRKSVRTIAAEEMAKQLIPENAKESLNTLQEISSWIQQHPEDVAEMNKNITINSEAIITNTQNIETNTNDIKSINEELESLTFITIVDNRPSNIDEAIPTLIYSEPSENQQYRNLYIIEIINDTRQWKLIGYTAMLTMQWQTLE